MSWILAAALLAAPPADEAVETFTAAQVVAEIDSLPTGTLIFCKGDCLAVRIYTRSRFTHVAAVTEQGGRAYVYDSVNGSGVRRQELAGFLSTQTPGEIQIVKPRQAFTKRQRERFCAELGEQLGRPYAVKHHLTGKRNEGLHCAEYVTDALMAAGVMTANNSTRVSPASLYEGVHKRRTYIPQLTVCLKQPMPARAESWCGRTWQDTKSCTKRCYLKLRGWFCCY